MLKLYENIKSLRLQNHMTQDELARKAGYTDRSSIAKIERGMVDLSQSKIKQFADIFGVTPSHLMGWTVEEETNKNSGIVVLMDRMRKDPEFFKLVSELNKLEGEKLEHVKNTIAILHK